MGAHQRSVRPVRMPFIKRTKSLSSASFAQRRSASDIGRSFMTRPLRAASDRKATAERACKAMCRAVWVQPEGVVEICVSHPFNFAPVYLVIQPVIPLHLLIEAPMQQIQLSLLCRLDAPSVVPIAAIKGCLTYRQAVQLCWNLRRVRNMTRRRLAEDAGLYPPHVSCYLNDNKRARDLPGSAVRAFEYVCGNTAISQWHGLNSKLTCLEEMQLRGVA